MKKSTLLLSSLLMAGGLTLAHAAQLDTNFQAYAAEEGTTGGETEEQVEAYPVNFDKSATKNTRILTAIQIEGSEHEEAQTVSVPNTSYIYNEVLGMGEGFDAKPGEVLATEFQWNGGWMHGFVYVDYNKNGQFYVNISEEDCSSLEGNELVAFPYAQHDSKLGLKDENGTEYPAWNSDGEQATAREKGYNPPAFALPEELPAGYYRMRFKLDWAGTNPGGRMDENEDLGANPNDILQNKGSVFDVRLHIHGDVVNIAAIGKQATITTESGEALATAPYGEALNVKGTAPEGVELAGVIVRYGYGFDEASEVYGMEQWKEVSVPASQIVDGILQLPAEVMSANVQLEAVANTLDAAKEVIAIRGVGYPTEDSEAYINLSQVIAAVEADPSDLTNYAYIADELKAYKSATVGIQMPVANKLYAMKYVTNAGKMAYLDNTGSDIALVPCTAGEELPESAAFACELNDNGTYSFKTSTGAYLVYHSKYGGVNWLQGLGNTTGIQETKDDMTDITIAKLIQDGEVKANGQENLFGMMTWYSKRGFDTGKGVDAYGYTVVKTDFSNYDGAAAPFYNNNYTSAIVFEELGDVLVGIDNAVISTSDASAVYTLSGVKLGKVDTKTLPAGLYIVNGKKVIVK